LTTENIVGRWLAAAVTNAKEHYTVQPTIKGIREFFVFLFICPEKRDMNIKAKPRARRGE